MDLISFWIGKKVGQGEGRDVLPILGIIFVPLFIFIILLTFNPQIALLFLSILLLTFAVAFFTAKSKKK